MSLLILAKKLVEVTATECQERRPGIATQVRKAICKEIHLKQYEGIEQELAEILSKVFNQHIDFAKSRLEQLSEKDASDAIANQIVDIQGWTADLINAAFPVLAAGMQEAAQSQWLMMGGQLDERTAEPLQHKSLAMDWLMGAGLEVPPGLSFILPKWMIDGIVILLRLSFVQEYWQKVAETTRNDIETFLRVGMQEGESLQTIARKIHNRFPSEYTYRRGLRVARTESGNALNGARDMAIEQMKKELGPEAGQYIGKSWLAVLDERTRDPHARLDGVIADKDGMWEMEGHKIPWPAHVSLPPDLKCNCRCTILSEYGVQPNDFSGQPAPEE